MATNSKGDSVTKSVSMPPELLEQVDERMKALGRRNFSDYARSLIQNDLAARGDLIIREQPGEAKIASVPPKTPVSYFKTKPKPKK